ncbi:hypothetical protein GCM10011390_46970 [Aureimonas endophytica]|uniref:diguanylate cyclase n=1 Tax=Aureimonas endophytica TaxID=2027858 RepID=A0A917A3H5_9HYPH|nr:GGDEF domain-containing protein [Aureimonas endophytica]GGE22200.1 hypothetical protein GCM10011390_46970 [Aureimonas endophytica]
MESSSRILRFMSESLGLTFLAAAATIIGGWHYFNGFTQPGSMTAVGFALVALILAAIPLQAYLAFRVLPIMQRNARLQRAAMEDSITGLLNTASFRATFGIEASRLGRPGEDRSATFLLVSIDHFKRLHDSFGHGSGDRALRLVANMLRETLKPEDVVGRLGSEEFGVFLHDAGFEEARRIAETLRRKAGTLVVGPNGAARPLAISIGGVSFASPLPFEMLFAASDVNLFRAKQTGQNRCLITNAVRTLRRPGDNRGATRALAGMATGIDGSVLARRPLRQTPVEPKPPVPRAVEPKAPVASVKLAS